MNAAPIQRVANIGVGLLLLLSLLTALDAMAIDMYLPAMPAIASEFGVSPGRIQQTLSIFLAGLAIGQAIYGPLLDRFGRRTPLLLGLAIFVLGSMLGMLAPSVEWLLAARFVQALGAAAGLVTPRAIVSDLCSLNESARIYSLLMQVMMIATILAPLIGGFYLERGGWRLDIRRARWHGIDMVHAQNPRLVAVAAQDIIQFGPNWPNLWAADSQWHIHGLHLVRRICP